MADDDAKAGYDVCIFVDQDSASDHMCSICLCVFNEPMSIGCDEGHVFCKQCLDDYFKDDVRMRCPLDQQLVHKKNISPNKYAERLVNSFRVVCPLQYEHDDAKTECAWQGSLSDMRSHTREQCGLFVMQCQHCGNDQKRRDMDAHVEKCDERLIPCPLRCNESIKQRLLAGHIDVKCRMKSVNCDDCKESVFRKDMQYHQEMECEERLCKCPYAGYGCTQMGKARELQAHVARNEMKHLQFQVEHIMEDKKLQMHKMENLESTVAHLKQTLRNQMSGYGGGSGRGCYGSYGGGGDRRANDWDCPKCSFHNFGSRSYTCTKCDTPKPSDAAASGDSRSYESHLNSSRGRGRGRGCGGRSESGSYDYGGGRRRDDGYNSSFDSYFGRGGGDSYRGRGRGSDSYGGRGGGGDSYRGRGGRGRGGYSPSVSRNSYANPFV